MSIQELNSPRNVAVQGRKILAVFSAAERRRFLSESTLQDISGVVFATSPEANPEAWMALLREERPEVLVGSWSMPPLTDAMVAELPELRYICYFCGSVRGKVPRSFLQRGGMVSNWGAAAAPTVAECALLLILGSLRRASHFFFEMHCEKGWKSIPVRPPESLRGRRVGIHGMGAVARMLIAYLAPFGVKIEAWSAPVPDTVYEQHGIRKARDLNALFEENDIVVEVEGLTPQNVRSVGAELLDRLRPGAVFVNVGRGKIVDEQALVNVALRGDVFIGLDVFETEPLPASSPLRGLRNVMLFPHTAGPTLDQSSHIARHAIANLQAYLATGAPNERVTLEHYDNAT